MLTTAIGSILAKNATDLAEFDEKTSPYLSFVGKAFREVQDNLELKARVIVDSFRSNNSNERFKKDLAALDEASNEADKVRKFAQDEFNKIKSPKFKYSAIEKEEGRYCHVATFKLQGEDAAETKLLYCPVSGDFVTISKIGDSAVETTSKNLFREDQDNPINTEILKKISGENTDVLTTKLTSENNTTGYNYDEFKKFKATGKISGSTIKSNYTFSSKNDYTFSSNYGLVTQPDYKIKYNETDGFSVCRLAGKSELHLSEFDQFKVMNEVYFPKHKATESKVVQSHYVNKSSFSNTSNPIDKVHPPRDQNRFINPFDPDIAPSNSVKNAGATPIAKNFTRNRS
jgi:hypothetical protein